MEIGNEDWFDKSGSYDGRFAQFYDAIKAKYPNLQVISTVGYEHPESQRVHSRVPDLVDEHYYRSLEEMQDHALDYDKYSVAPTRPRSSWASGPPASDRRRPTWLARSATPPG